MDISPEDPRTLHGAAAAAAGRAALEQALGSPEAVRRAVGRPTLDPAGRPAKVRRVRVPEPLDARVELAVAAGAAANYSALVRDALGEYLERHVVVGEAARAAGKVAAKRRAKTSA